MNIYDGHFKKVLSKHIEIESSLCNPLKYAVQWQF